MSNQKMNRGNCVECGKTVPNFDFKNISDKPIGGKGDKFFCNIECYIKRVKKIDAELREKYPYLKEVKQGNHKSILVTAAKNIRIELKKRFPDTKFKVTTSRYSMGTSIYIEWTGEGLQSEIRVFTDKYLMGSFDGLTDSYNYCRTQFNNLYGEVKFISCISHKHNTR